MPKVGEDAELQTLTECQYSYPQETLTDLQKVRTLFVDLRLYVDFYCFSNEKKKRLVYLAGTVPVRYEGSVYNIPVCIWLHETHPISRPRCYVCPSVSMVINPSCPCVDVKGNISLDGLANWTYGMSNLVAIISEMKKNFQKHIPLFSKSAEELPTAGTQASHSGASAHRYTPSATPATTSPHLSEQKASQSQQIRVVQRSYTEDLHGIDFSNPFLSSPSSSTQNNPFLNTSSTGDSSAVHLDKMMGALKLDSGSSRDCQAESPVQITQSAGNQCSTRPKAPLTQNPKLRARALPADVIQMASHLPSHQAAIFFSLMTKEEHKFCPADVMEAVQLSRDYPSALRFLTHDCPICQEQVSFSKIITMTHCSCFLCQTCFIAFFSAAIKERSVEQLVCPQCNQPKIRGQKGMEESVEYFNLLDTQIRHFLPSEIHELFQRKLRDRALLEMPNFCWCAHCSFGILHEADRLRMDCPSCNKSTCSKCRTPWSPHHEGLSCVQFKVLQQQHQTEQQGTTAQLYTSIVCPNCHLNFSLSKGGCLHFTCTQCQHQFCGSCSSCFNLGTACSFSTDCANKGLHAHHPRDCLYHLRDWSVSRLLLLLQCYSVSMSWMEDADSGSTDIVLPAVCSVLEMRDDDRREEEPCGRPTLPEYKGYCQVHYKERLVELLNRFCADPAVLFTEAELVAELHRWLVSVPTRDPDEPELLYTERLRMVLTTSVALKGSISLY